MILIGIIFSVIFFRFFFIRFNNGLWSYFSNGPYGDASTYFFLIQFFRKHNCGVSDERCLITKQPVLIPSIYLKMVALLFSDKLLYTFSWLPNFLIYSLASSAFIYFTYNYFGGLNIYFFYTIIIFISLPDNLSLDKHRIQFAVLQPRYLGVIVNSAFWFVYCFYGFNMLGLISMLIFSFISLNISIFSRQSIIFLSVITSLISFNPNLILILLIASLMSAIIFPKEFIPSILPQIKYSYQYFLNYYKPSLSANPLINFLKNLISRPILDSYPYVSYYLTLIFSIFYYLNYNDHEIYGNGLLNSRFLFISLSIFIVFIFTGIRKFAFLGECWRYISFNSYFLTPISIVILVSSLGLTNILMHSVLCLIILFNLAILAISKRDSLVNKNIWLTPLLLKNKEILSSAIWYGLPYRVSTFAVALGYGKATFEYQYGNHSKEIHDEYFSIYPYLKWDEVLMRKNGVTHILLENELIESAVNSSGFTVEGLQVIDSNNYFSIFKYS